MPTLLLPPPSRHRFLLPLAMLHSSSPSPSSPLPQQETDTINVNQAISYHNRTKHSLSAGYAAGPGRLDWANQPNPFLRFPPSPSLPLIHPLSSLPLIHPLSSEGNQSCKLFSDFSSIPPSPLSIASLSSLFYYSLSLSAWKTTGFSTWSLRVNPSSGNLHPTECHVISPPLSGYQDSGFVSHYCPKDHSLELRTLLPKDSAFPLPPNSVLLVLSSIFWREAWKYGERALRYCNHDIGHAIASIAISAATLGWDTCLVDSLSHSELESLIGVPQIYPSMPSPLPDKPVRGNLPWVESQYPDCALLIFPMKTEPEFSSSALSEYLKGFPYLDWIGKPNSLSKDHVCWDVIYRTAGAIKKNQQGQNSNFSVNPYHNSGLISEELYGDFTVHEVIRKRRSAVDMDRVHLMKRETFYQILLHCLPSGVVGPGEKQGKQFALPFRVLDFESEVHLALFVHRVEGLERGLYFLVRNEGHFGNLRRAFRPEFEWAPPDGCPAGLPLYRLAKGDCQKLAKQISCFQDIASDGCFSLGMVARFEPVLREKGVWMYPRLFWETGIIGQVLYLEAHAVGISATGIGCYFDDAMHETLGTKGMEFQSLYHFTVGGPVLDKRIMSLPAYPGPDIDA